MNAAWKHAGAHAATACKHVPVRLLNSAAALSQPTMADAVWQASGAAAKASCEKHAGRERAEMRGDRQFSHGEAATREDATGIHADPGCNRAKVAPSNHCEY